MKYLLLLFLIASCGKHDQPKMKDLRDSDGDGKLNDSEINKLAMYISDLAPIESVKVEMRIKIIRSINTELRVNLSNQIDLVKHSKELLVKNPKQLPVDEYFSEWSKLKIDSTIIPTLPDQPTFRIDLCFNQISTPPDKLLLITKEGTRYLSAWSPLTSLELSRKDTQAILSGEAFISIGRNTKTFSHSTESQDQSIKNKTYRVFMNDGISTAIYYVSKEFSFDQFLKEKGIYEYQDIANQNLLTARHSSEMPQWWINEINGKDKVVIKEDLNNLSNFYIDGLEKLHLKIQRNNGKALTSARLVNAGETKILLRMRAQKSLRSFNIVPEQSVYGRLGGGGRDGNANAGTKCTNYYRKVSNENAVELTELELRHGLVITSNGQKIDMSPSEMEILSGSDEIGTYFEISFQSTNSTIEVNFRDLENSTFVSTGLYNTTCHGIGLKTNPTNYEGFLDLAIEAYIDTL